MSRILIVPAGADNPEAPAHSPGLYTTLVLEAALRGAGIGADVFLYSNESWPTAREHLLGRVKEKQYDIIGLSFMSYNRCEAYELLREFEKIVPRCRMIVGGVHATFLYEQLLRKFTNIRAVALGEGEQALIGFCRDPDRLEAVPGIAYRDEAGRVQVNPRAQDSRRDLDDLPMVDYTLLRDYRGAIPLQTTRGCVARCVFCSWRTMEQTVKRKSPERIAREWAGIRDLFGPDRHIAVFDALHNVSLEHVKGMCRALIDRGLTANPWDTEIRAKPVDREMMELMKQAGCKRLLIGVETGNEEIRKKIGKGISNQDIENVFALAHEVRMPTFPFLIVGLPGETQETVAETVQFVRALRPYYCPTTVAAQVYPGTKLYDMMKERGLISDAYWLYRHPKNWGDMEAFANMPLYTAEHNLFEIARWVEAHNHGVASLFAPPVPQNRLILNDEEYERCKPWPDPNMQPKLARLLKGESPGTWKGRARRLLRGIKTRIHVVPRRLHRGQSLAVSISIRTHRPADFYLFLLQPGDAPVLPLVWRENHFAVCEMPSPFAANVPGGQPLYWADVLAPAPGFYVAGRYTFYVVVCAAGQSVFRREHWLDWKKRTFGVCELE
jgi:radical SAM superfamily enzyme YgiQ (UPF0313 family)